MKKSRTYLSFILGLIIVFPIIFQSFHAVEHHVLEDDFHVVCCEHNEEHQQSNKYETTPSYNIEVELCPICEYQIVYFLDNKPILPEQEYAFLHDLKTPILNHPIVQFRGCKNKLRGPPFV